MRSLMTPIRLWPLSTAMILCGFAAGRRVPPDAAALHSLVVFRSNEKAGAAGGYVPLKMHALPSPIDRPVDPHMETSMSGYAPPVREQYRPAVRQQWPAVSETMPGSEDRVSGEPRQLSPFSRDVEESEDSISRALRSWGWLSREVLESEWLREQPADQSSFPELALPSQAQGYDSGRLDPFDAFSGDSLQESLLPDENEDEGLWRLPSQDPGRLSFGTGRYETEAEPAAPERWRPYTAPSFKSDLPAADAAEPGNGGLTPEGARSGRHSVLEYNSFSTGNYAPDDNRLFARPAQ